MPSSFWLSFALILHSRAFNLHCHFCTHDHIAIMYSKMANNISVDSYGACAQEIQPFLKFTYLFVLITYIKIRYLHNGNHLKECHLWLILKRISQNTAFNYFRVLILFGHRETYRHPENLAGQFQAIK